MSEVKIYPGPWAWEFHPDTRKPVALSSKDGDVLLATGDDFQSWANVSPEHMAALAAVPELVKACWYALDMLDQDAGGETVKARIGGIGGYYAAALLRAALAKAKGGWS